jgi:hypothetical protein
MSRKMNAEVQDQFRRLHVELVWLWVRWKNFRQLFAEGPETLAILNWVAPSFFGTIQHVMLNDIAIGLCRITDPAQIGRRQNLTLDRLADGIDTVADVGLVDDLRTRLSAITEKTTPMRDHRNWRVAHLDLEKTMSTEQEVSLGFSRQTIGEALKMVGEFLNQLGTYFGQVPCNYEATITARGDAEFLVSQLRKLPPANPSHPSGA